MKTMKRILAGSLCFCLIFCCMSMTSLAEGTGSITIENQSGSNASVAGKTLNLFKIFNATSDGQNISYQWVEEEDGSNRYESFFFGTKEDQDDLYPVTGEESGTIHDVVAYINGIKDDSFAFSQMAAKLHQYIHDNNITPTQSAEVPDTSTSYTFSDLDLGYYLVYDATILPEDSPAVRSAAMLVHSGENKVIKLKADRPHIEKTVDDSDTTTPNWKLGTTASVGETVTYRIATMVPNHDLYGENYVFEITDQIPDSLILDEDSIKVTITEAASVGDEDTPDNAQTTYQIITKANAQSGQLADGEDFKIVFTDITALGQDSVVEVTYDAVVSASAEFKNTNTATLTYSNDPNNLDSIGSVEASATVMLWQFTLTKYMEDTSGTPSYIRLGGAEFEIYNKNDLENPLQFTTTTVTNDEEKTYLKYTYNPTVTSGAVTVLSTVNTGDDGKADVGYTDGGNLGQILIFGLGEGTYVIRETKAPDGYQIAKGDFEFTVTDTIGITGAISNAAITEATRAESPGQFTRVLIQETDQKYYVGITNAPGAALPETGGMGTTMFTLMGVVLMAGAVAFFTLRKRNSIA